MKSSYTPMPMSRLSHGITCMTPSERAEPRCTNDTPAIELMTDFSRVDPVAVTAGTRIDDAHEHMKLEGVRSALVTGSGGELLGFVSSSDINGEVPVQLQQSRSLPRAEVTVSDIMLRLDQIPAVKLRDVSAARVGDLTETFKQVGRHHVLVLSEGQAGDVSICGMFSSRDIARALDVEVTPSRRAMTFVELWSALASQSRGSHAP